MTQTATCACRYTYNETEVVIIGSGGHGKVIADSLQLCGYKNIVFVDDTRTGELLGLPIVGKIEDLPRDSKAGFIIGVGDNYIRGQIALRLLVHIPEAKFINSIHPTAIVAHDVVMGVGNVILAGAIVDSGGVLGDHCIVNTHALLGHDGHMDDFSSIGPGVNCGGGCHIGELSAVCMGSVLREKTQVGCNTVIGMGSLVLNNCMTSSVYYGSPAQRVRSRVMGEKYLK